MICFLTGCGRAPPLAEAGERLRPSLRPSQLPELAAGDELIGLLAEAVTEGWIAVDAARLIGRIRLGFDDAASIAEETGVEVQSVRTRRRRAEQRLVAAVAAA